MARQPVLQPNGKLAIYGTIVDNFVALDCTVDQAIASLVTWYGPEHAVDLERVVKLCADGQLVFEWWKDWPDRLAWAKFLHGKDDEMVRKAWYRTPDMMARRYIDQFVAACQAESRTDEAIIELTVARQRITELEAQLAAMTTRAETAEAAAQYFGNEWAQAVQLGTKLSEQWAAATKRAEQAEHSLANLTAQLAAVGTYVRYYAAANDAYMAVGRPSVLSFDEWWQTAHCPNCGNVQVDRAPGPSADLWECAGRDGCGYNWPAEPQT